MNSFIFYPLFIISMLSSPPAWSAEFSCETLDIKPEAKTYTQHGPDYFTKSVPIPRKDKSTHFKGFMEPDEDLGTYIAQTSGDNNRIIRLNRDTHIGSGKKRSIEYEVPGPFDPVPSPDGRILSVASPMRLYDIREFLIGGDDPPMPQALAESLIDGVYQSIAWLRDKALTNALQNQYNNMQLKDNQRLYRLVTDSATQIPMIDFLVTYKPDCKVTKELVAAGEHCIDLKVLKPSNQEEPGSWAHCGEKALKTLFISRRGTYLSGYSTTADGGTTKILDISKVGECPEVLDFAHPTGKVDFNDDENMVTFHVDYLNDHSGSYFIQVDGTRTKDVYIMDLKKISDSKLKGINLRRLSTTTTKGKGCYYPSFFNDQETNADGEKIERILCMFDEGNEEETVDGFDFRTVEVTGLVSATEAFLPIKSDPSSITPENKIRLHNGALVGLIWGKACNPADNDEYSAVQAASLFLNIKYEDCMKIVELWRDNSPAGMNFKRQLSSDMRFEDDPRFGEPSYILGNITTATLTKSCNVAKSYQETVKKRKENVTTRVFGSPDAGQSVHLTGAEIAQRKCTGCHHYNVPLNAALNIDLNAGISSFPNLFEFGGHRKVPLIFIDASLERIGYDPLSDPGTGDPTLVPGILKYLGEEPTTSRQMPPVLRVQLEETTDYNERKILGKYLYQLRKERVAEITATDEQEVQ